jgi:hypothetical protein
MIGGLILSQILTFYTTPVIYIFFDRLAQRFRHGRSEAPLAPPLDERPVEELS